MTAARTGMIAWLGGVVGLATAIVVATPVSGSIRLPLVVLFACAGPGCAVVAHLRRTDAVSALALSVVLSLTLFVGISAVLGWTSWWQPRATVLTLAVATVASCAVALVVGRGRPKSRAPRPAGAGRTA